MRPRSSFATLPMVPGNELAFPRRFGPYVLVRPLAEGGMGQVFLALTGMREANKLCVVKRIGNTRAAHAFRVPELEARFRREATIAMALSHAAIVHTFSAGQQDGLYIVQEYVHGLSLQRMMSYTRSGAEMLPVSVACYVAVQVARALAYLHNFESRGLVHRDVTPENIMLASSGEVKLIDFGVAKSTLWNEGLTQAGTIFGKPNWVAPELLVGRNPDRRTDLFSLGLVCWHVLTGRNPGATAIEPATWAAEFPPPSTFNPQVPASLDKLVARAIEPDPERRFQTAEELQQALAACAPAGPPGEQELAQLVSRQMSLHQDTALASEVESAALLLDPVERASPTKATGKHSKERARWLWRASWIAAVAVLVVGVLIATRHSPSVPPALPSSPPPLATERNSAVERRSEPPKGPEQDLPTSTAIRPAEPMPFFYAPSATLVPRVHKARRQEPKAGSEVDRTAEAEQALSSALERLERAELAAALALAEQSAKLGAGARAHILIGRIRALKQDFAGAQAAFEEAIRLAPDHEEAKRRLERLRSAPREGAR